MKGLSEQYWEAVVGFRPARAVGVFQIATPGVLAAIGLEPVDTDLVEQVAAALAPPAAGLRIGEVRKQRPREPPAAVAVGGTVGLADAQAPRFQCGGVGGNLPGLAPVGRHERDLPEQHTDTLLVQPPHHAHRIRPRTVGRECEVGEPVRAAIRMDLVGRVPEGHERRLVAPRLDDHDADGYALTQAPADLLFDPLLRVPLVPAHPRLEDPWGGHRRLPGRVEKSLHDLVRRPRPERQLQDRIVRIHLGLDHDPVRIRGAEVEPGSPRGDDVEAPVVTTDDDRHRHRQIGASALVLVLLEHDRIEDLATVVNGCVALAEPDDVLVGVKPEPEPHPGRAVDRTHQPADRRRLKARVGLAGDRDPAAVVGPVRGVDIEAFGRQGRAAQNACDAVAERARDRRRCHPHGRTLRESRRLGRGREVTLGRSSGRVRTDLLNEIGRVHVSGDNA